MRNPASGSVTAQALANSYRRRPRVVAQELQNHGQLSEARSTTAVLPRSNASLICAKLFRELLDLEL